MAEKPDEKPAAPAAKPAPPAKPVAEEKAAPAARAKIVEETGRYICKSGITFTNEKGERAHAKVGDVVGVGPEDVKRLKKIGAIVEETREE